MSMKGAREEDLWFEQAALSAQVFARDRDEHITLVCLLYRAARLHFVAGYHFDTKQFCELCPWCSWP